LGAGAPPRGGFSFLLRFDGACVGNPGPGGAGAVLYGVPAGAGAAALGADDAAGVARGGWEPLWMGAARCGRATTNNVAEYRGLLLGLRAALRLGVARAGARLAVQGDSELVVRQVAGDYDVKAEHLKPLRAEAAALLAELRARSVRVELAHVLRACNAEADRLSNVGLERDLSAPRADALARFGCWSPPEAPAGAAAAAAAAAAGAAGAAAAPAPAPKRARDADAGGGAAKRAREASDPEDCE